MGIRISSLLAVFFLAVGLSVGLAAMAPTVSALTFIHLDPAQGPAVLRGNYRLNCYQYVCSDQGETGEGGQPPYSEFTGGLNAVDTPSGLRSVSLNSGSLEGVLGSSGRYVYSGNEYGDLSWRWNRQALHIRLSVDEDVDVRISANLSSEGRGVSTLELSGPPFPRDERVAIRLRGSTANAADQIVRLIAGVVYSLDLLAESSAVGRNGTAASSLNFSIVPIPEPGTGLLLGLGLLALGRWGRIMSCS